MTYENANGFKWEPGQSPCRWRPARFMPKEFSRPELRRVLDSMKAERLQDITEEDAIAEGIDDATLWDHFAREYEDRPVAYLRRSMFVSLWQSINAKAYPWASNPWVWALTFEVVT